MCNSSPLAATAAHSRAREYGIASRDTVAVRWQVGRREGRKEGRKEGRRLYR